MVFGVSGGFLHHACADFPFGYVCRVSRRRSISTALRIEAPEYVLCRLSRFRMQGCQNGVFHCTTRAVKSQQIPFKLSGLSPRSPQTFPRDRLSIPISLPRQRTRHRPPSPKIKGAGMGRPVHRVDLVGVVDENHKVGLCLGNIGLQTARKVPQIDRVQPFQS